MLLDTGSADSTAVIASSSVDTWSLDSWQLHSHGNSVISCHLCSFMIIFTYSCCPLQLAQSKMPTVNGDDHLPDIMTPLALHEMNLITELPAVWDHAVLPATRHKWIRPALTSASKLVPWIDDLHCQQCTGWQLNSQVRCPNVYTMEPPNRWTLT